MVLYKVGFIFVIFKNSLISILWWVILMRYFVLCQYMSLNIFYWRVLIKTILLYIILEFKKVKLFIIFCVEI